MLHLYYYTPSVTYRTRVLATSPVAYWPMGEATGNLADASGNGWTATVTGSPTYGVAGPTVTRGTGVTWDGTNTMYAETSASLTTPPGTALTVMCWFLTSAAATDYLVTRVNTGSTSWQLTSESGVVGANLLNTSNAMYGEAYAGSGLNDGSWHWAAMTWDGTTLTAYADASTATDTTFSGTWVQASTAPVRISTGYATYINNFTGSTCHAAIWNRVLTSAELTTMRTGA